MPTKRDRPWFMTLNNWSEPEKEQLISLGDAEGCRYYVIGEEVGKKTGTPHLQGFFFFNEPGKSLAGMKKINKRANWEPKYKKSTFAQVIEYCKKEEKYVEWGEPPMDDADKVKKRKLDVAERWECIKQGRFDQLPPENLATYEKIYKRKFKPRPPKRPLLDNLWIMGPTGIGKSRYMFEKYPDAYLKGCDKWWCDYEDDDVVVIDDVDPPGCKELTQLFKWWTDYYPFKAETKHGSIPAIRPKRVICTSNFTIDQCFGYCEEIVEPMKRRFRVINGIKELQEFAKNEEEVW